jgi:hypothetical protein
MLVPNYEVGDIVMTQPPYKPQVFVITEIDPSRPKNCYNGKCPTTGKSYRLGDDGLAKIGEATDEYMNGDGENEAGVTAVVPVVFEAGRRRAAAEAMFGAGSPRQKQWLKLSEAKTGDVLRILIRGGIEEVTFRNVLARGTKFVFLATTRAGKTFKYPETVIVLD